MVFLSRYMVPTQQPYIGYRLKPEYNHLAPDVKERPSCYTLSSIFLPESNPTHAVAMVALKALDAEEREYPGIIKRSL